MRTRRPLGIPPEAAGKRVRIRVTCVPEGGGEVSNVAAEIICSGPIPSGSLTVPQPFKIEPHLDIVTAAIDREIIGDRRENIILANLTPAIEPVDIRHCRLPQATPVGC